MNDSTQGTSVLRQRMIEDMRMRKLSPKTQVTYIRSVRRLAAHLGRSPDTATVEDLRNYLRPTFVCRHCGAPMLIIETIARAQHIRGPPSSSAAP